MKLWCNVCDNMLVDTKDETTGVIFEAHGHVVNHQAKKIVGCETVIFAVCCACKLSGTVEPTTLKLDEEYS